MIRKNIEIYDKRMKIYSRDYFTCQYPGCDVTGCDNLQMAHRIRQHQEKSIIEYWLREFGEEITKTDATEILNNDLNIVSMCARHNCSVDITFNPVERDKILRQIKAQMDL